MIRVDEEDFEAVRHLLDSDGVSRHQMFAVTIASPQEASPDQRAG